MGKLRYFIINEVKGPEGHGFYVRTMETHRHFYPFWDVAEYMMKDSPEGRIEPFHSLVFPKRKRRPAVCIGNDNKVDAIMTHRKLYILFKKGYLMGP